MRLIQISLVWLKKSPPFLEGFFNKLPQVISRILSEAIIYLSSWLPNGIKLPTHRGLKEGERVTPQTSLPRPMWHFSTQGLPPTNITIGCRELLPPVFTLICLKADGNFLWHFLFPLLMEPGFSPVRRSRLSGLSSLFYQRDSVLRQFKIK